MNPFVPKIEMLIATQLEEHKYCDIKKHTLVVSEDNSILLKHKKQISASDKIIALLEQKDIRNGFTARKWNHFSKEILKITNTVPDEKKQGLLFQD